MTPGKHTALVRGDDGLTIRRFATADDAQAASAARETVPSPNHKYPSVPMPSVLEVNAIAQGRSGLIHSVDFAKRLGLRPYAIRRAWQKGWLPGCLEHGERTLMIPIHLLRLAQTYGLKGLGRIVQAGRLEYHPRG